MSGRGWQLENAICNLQENNGQKYFGKKETLHALTCSLSYQRKSNKDTRFLPNEQSVICYIKILQCLHQQIAACCAQHSPIQLHTAISQVSYTLQIHLILLEIHNWYHKQDLKDICSRRNSIGCEFIGRGKHENFLELENREFTEETFYFQFHFCFASYTFIC